MKRFSILKSKKIVPPLSFLTTSILLSTSSYASVIWGNDAVINNGSLTSTGAGTSSAAWIINNLFNGLAITNTATGTIKSESTGLLIGGNNKVSINNQGSIKSTQNGNGSWNDSGIRNEGIVSSFINSGTIESWRWGIFFNGGYTEQFINSSAGLVSSTTSAAVLTTGPIANFINDGTISGYTAGIQFDGEGSISNLINNGVITATGPTSQWYGSGIFLNGTKPKIGTLTNNNLITTDQYGILNYGTIGTINNFGDIKTAGTGILSYGEISEINNYGTIITTRGDRSQAIFFGASSGTTSVSLNTINNYGTLSAVDSSSIDINNNNKLIINNQGTIKGATGINVSNAAPGVVITNTGKITGDKASINILSDDVTVYNYGSLIGDVNFKGLSSIYLLGNDTKIDGNIVGGNASLLSIGSSTITSSFDALTTKNVNVDKIIVDTGSLLKLYSTNSWTASSTDGDAFLNNGTVTFYQGNTTLNSNVTNNGIFSLIGDKTINDTNALNRNQEIFNTLTISGNYTGNGGHLILSSALEGDASPTDKLIINGNASGTTYVQVNNMGGTGAKTVNGIKIIDVAGTSTADAFVKNGRIVAGSYEYDLVKGNVSGTDTNSWYLTSNDDRLRPEAGSYIANLASANSLFNTSLHDRLGETQYTDWLTGEKSVTSMWLRSAVGRDKFKAGGSQLKNKTHWHLMQLGGDIAQWSNNDVNRLHLGLMAGLGRSRNDTDNQQGDYRSKGDIDGYSVGLYGTWYDNNTDKTGLYVDSWALWNHFNAKVNGQQVDREKYKLKGLTAAIESGYTFKLGHLDNYNYWLQPKAQFTYMGVDADNHTESNGTLVKNDINNWQSRLGLRLSASANDLVSNQSNNTGQVFIEANWLHNTELFDIKMDDDRTSQDGARNIAELKSGIEANILTNTNVWFNVDYQRGSHDYHNIGAMLGTKYSF